MRMAPLPELDLNDFDQIEDLSEHQTTVVKTSQPYKSSKQKTMQQSKGRGGEKDCNKSAIVVRSSKKSLSLLDVDSDEDDMADHNDILARSDKNEKSFQSSSKGQTNFSKLMKMISPKFARKNSDPNTAKASGGKKTAFPMFSGFLNSGNNQKKGLQQEDVELTEAKDFNRAMSDYCVEEERKCDQRFGSGKSKAMPQTTKGAAGNKKQQQMVKDISQSSCSIKD